MSASENGYVRFLEAESRKSYPHKGWRLGRLLLTSCVNGTGAPAIDDCCSTDIDGNKYHGKAILIAPWRKNRHGEHKRGRAIVLAWRTR